MGVLYNHSIPMRLTGLLEGHHVIIHDTSMILQYPQPPSTGFPWDLHWTFMMRSWNSHGNHRGLPSESHGTSDTLSWELHPTFMNVVWETHESHDAPMTILNPRKSRADASWKSQNGTSIVRPWNFRRTCRGLPWELRWT